MVSFHSKRVFTILFTKQFTFLTIRLYLPLSCIKRAWRVGGGGSGEGGLLLRRGVWCLYPPVASQLIFNRKRRKKQTSLHIVFTPKNLPTTHGDLNKCSDRSMEYILLLKRISLSLCKQRYLGGMYSHKPLSKKFFLWPTNRGTNRILECYIPIGAEKISFYNKGIEIL